MNNQKKLLMLLTVAGLMLTACNTANDFNDLSQQDQVALLGMEEAIFSTIAYNDSLANYINDTGITQDSTCYYFDDHYHRHDSLFNMHHNNYSHGNEGDDHQCCNMMGNNSMGGQTNYMGNMMQNHDQNMMSHSMDDHYVMDSLEVAHEQYHPGE